MNLELLDPFRRQIPDRVDATLNLPAVLHFRNKKIEKSETQDDDWKAANHVAFNRRGAYVAVGYGSGAVAVYDVLSRTLSGLYRGETNEEESTAPSVGHGVTSLSWSRRSRTLLAGAVGDAEVRLIDTTHPFGPEECCIGISTEENKSKAEDDRSQSPTTDAIDKTEPKESSFAEKDANDHHKKPRILKMETLPISKEVQVKPRNRSERQYPTLASAATTKRYPSIHFQLPCPVGSSMQVHPRDACAGLVAMNDGSLAAFWVPNSAWADQEEEPKVKSTTFLKSDEHFVTCASFDPQGDRIYAATKEGKLLGFDVTSIFDAFSRNCSEMPHIEPSFTIQIPGGATAWHLIVSRNGQYLIINSADAALRLYSTKECWKIPEEVERPTWVFQDVVSKVKFASCDISGDAEFVVGGTNGIDNKYELYIWNTSTGALMDKLTGATVELYSVAWHPTRSFLAVAASDGLVDIWGPRINWTAFAPDFQALPQNVEYVECEDEFDVEEDANDTKSKNEEDDNENGDVDILTIEPVPVFASDSEGEEDVFSFETKVSKLLGAIAS